LNGVGESAARKRVAIEMVAKHERALRRTARRYSICVEDAEDAFQRALEILLTKAPPGEARELVRWMQTVTKHEALAVRRNRERHLGAPPPPGDAGETLDWATLIPSSGAGPAERAERHEEIARSREALQTLKPAELRALTLLAEGYSYAEIGEITGWTRTKINRSLAEGRERFRAFLTRSEAGERCTEVRPLLSAFCDGEASAAEAATLREHLRVCAHCRAAMRAYRAAPQAARALLPLPVLGARPLLERLHDTLSGLQARLAGRSLGGRAESAVVQAAASGGPRGAGMTAIAKALAICAGTAGGAVACVGAGVVPAPLDLGVGRDAATRVTPAHTRPAEATAETAPVTPVAAVEPSPHGSEGGGETRDEESTEDGNAAAEPTPEAAPVEAGAVEYTPPPAPPPAPASAPTSAGTGSAAGEFGP
jgi:RNA polymerase sigma factor (sigma-70 family)